MKEEIFNERLSLMQDYRKYNKTSPSKNDKYRGHPVGKYEETFRRIHNLGKLKEDGSYVLGTANLSKEQVDILEENGFDWMQNKAEIEWNKMYKVLIMFIKEKKRLPEPSEMYDDKLIGRWLEFQNAIFYNGKNYEDGSVRTYYDSLNKEQIEKLRKINAIRKSLPYWEKYYKLYVEYISQEEKPELDYDDPLQKWIREQKRVYNYGKKDYNGSIKLDKIILNKDKIKRLELVNFDFSL